MQFKRGVSPHGITAEAWLAAYRADEIHKRLLDGKEVTITSTTEGKHKVRRSSHYRGDAVDLRIWHTDAKGLTDEFVKRLKLSLGDDYAVVLEKTHIHVHWSPIYKPPLGEQGTTTA